MSEEELLEYLKNDLSKEEQYEVEQLMNEDPFTNDAVEGLQSLQEQQSLPNIVHALNHQLKKEIRQKKKRKKEFFSPTSSWMYFAILLILLICIIGYLLIKKGTSA